MINLKFFESTWNTILSLALTFSIIIIGFVIPPKFSTTLVESTIDYSLFSKFILGIAVALFLMPTLIYKKKKYAIRWWIASIGLLVISFVCFAKYYSLVNSKTILYADERYVIGNTPIKKVLDQVRTIEKKDGITLTNEEIVFKTGGNVSSIWKLQERQYNSLLIIFIYILTLVLFALSALSAIQALYCTVHSGSRLPNENTPVGS